MAITLEKYIEIKNLSTPERAFGRMENEFIDIMYTDHFSDSGVVMLLDVGIDPLKNEDIEWLKGLLDTVLHGIGETQYYVMPYTRCH